MRVLLDSHALLWFASRHRNLSERARSIMAEADNDLLLSAGSLWEIGVKVGLGKLTLAEAFDVFIEKAIVDNELTVLPISVRHVSALVGLPLHHRDPFDRLMVAQALVENVPILSADTALDAYPIERLW